MNRYRAFIVKEFQHVFRDGRTLLMLFGLPIIMIMLFGFALTNEIKNARVVIYDLNHHEASAGFIKKIGATRAFQIDRTVKNHDDIEEAFRLGKVRMAVVFPANFSSDLYHLNRAKLQVIADASDPNTATALSGYIRLMASGYTIEINQSNLNFSGIIPEIRMIYNPELKGATNFVPGIMALVFLVMAFSIFVISILKVTGSIST